VKINPTFSLFSALILAFIFGFSLSSNFKFPYETNQFLSVSVDNNPLITENEQNPASVSSDQIYEDSNNIDIEDRWKADDIEKMDVSVLPESDGAEINITAFSIYQTSEQIINNKSIPNINMTEGCLVEDVLNDNQIWHSPDRTSNYSRRFFNISIQVEFGLNLNLNCLSEMIPGILNDPRGWATVENTSFQIVDKEVADLNIVFASPDTVDELCYPLQTNGIYSCRNEKNVVINMYRWLSGAEDFNNEIATYRIYLINHEVGHYLGWGHTDCPSENALAPVMMQQSKSTSGCIPNGWPIYERVKLLYKTP
tara:strand:+ start:130 stop:1062 length:933 start_codon:yes stop_codon:yes gene_type:complete